ncbi:membrane protein FAM174A isoform X2 [Gopherus evgoodei]|uniref:membrane protein FAM174A isoform X2 n=1 Tax=Gopherus evgoodei TaxID=1825980 RepID=UPI0011CF1FAB|nr:membrane protein FAM174A isoform X2 [Gopherus evgoodei]
MRRPQFKFGAPRLGHLIATAAAGESPWQRRPCRTRSHDENFRFLCRRCRARLRLGRARAGRGGGAMRQALLWLLAGLLLGALREEAAAANSDPPARSTLPQGSTPGAATRSSNGSSSPAASPAPERDQPMTQRALAVLVVASAALIVYFVIRTVRLRKRNKKTRRYGVLDTNIENMELTPLEQDDDDDTTLFDANHPRRLVFRR